MKFGPDLHQHRVPAWADSYINYDRIKLLVRTGGEKGSFGCPMLSSHPALVLANWRVCRTPSPTKSMGSTRSLHVRPLSSIYASPTSRIVSITTSEPPASELCQVVVPELEDLQASLGDIQTAVLQLDWYNRVNQEAIQRLKYKQELVAGRPPLHSRSSTVDAARLWGSEPLASLNQFRVTVRTALTAGGPARHTSLLSRRWLHKRGLGIPGAARRAVATDDSAALDHLLHQVCSEKDRTLLARALLQLAAVYSAPRCCALLTPLSASRLAHVKEDADFLHHVIIRMGRQRDADSSQGLDQILRVLPESERWVLLHADALGRLALHYAAVYGLAGVCRHVPSYFIVYG